MSMHGDFRAAATWNNATVTNDACNSEQARIYLGLSPMPDRVLLYIDVQVAPDAAINRKAWAMDRFAADRRYLRAGRMTLACGLPLQNQQDFVRQISGINVDTPDDGMEPGYRAGPWDAQLAVSNGTAGGAESDNGKQYTGQAVRVQNRWRVGVGVNYNDSSTQRSTASFLFGGLRTGPVAWLIEADMVNAQPSGQIQQHLAARLLEADWLVQRGANLKLTLELLDPNRGRSGNLQTRFRVVGEYTPMQYLQLRLGARALDDHSAQYQAVNLAFLEVHVYF
jgi:hypothetical protein